MHGVWLFLKKSLSCCDAQKSCDAGDPDKNLIQKMKNPSGCRRSVSNLRNEFVTYGDEGAMQNPSFRSSRSLESSMFINTTKLEGRADSSDRFKGFVSGASSSDLLSGRYSSERFDVIGSDICGFGALSCRICRQRVRDLYAFETHYLSNHCVTRLLEGEFSRTTVELICNRGYSHKLGKTRGNNISAILKVQNLQRVVAEFENYRELVKIRATKLSKKHSRCVADGNEFLGFHGTTLSCSLGLSNSSSSTLCFSDQCGVCQILRNGFASKTRQDGIQGVLTASTCSMALECIETERGRTNRGAVKAVVLCRVIAGRVHKPMKKFEDPNGFSEFDSLALKVGPNSRLDELYLLSTKALLPCFVIIFKPRNNIS
ncbi:hypothetical protein Bca4012_061578 [Brassica carinata]